MNKCIFESNFLQDIALMIKCIDYKMIAKKHKASPQQMQMSIAFCLGAYYARGETFGNRYSGSLNFYKKILDLGVSTITVADKKKLIKDYPQLKLTMVNLRAFNYFKQGIKYENERNKRIS